MGVAAVATSHLSSAIAGTTPKTPTTSANDKPLPENSMTVLGKHYKPKFRLGLGGVAIGNAFKPTTDQEADETLAAAWEGGVRYFDTSPWYGLGLSERRFGHFLCNKDRDEYILSTKVGRVLKAGEPLNHPLWKKPSPFRHTYDYTAEGVRRSVEDSLQRLGINRIDIVFIHDLSPDNQDMGKKWTEYFDIAAKGAMPELTRMREEGIIKGWGLGVNEIDPCLRALEVADPDIFLSATQYSLVKHDDALRRLFPVCEKRGVSIVSGAPLNAGFLAGLDRFHYDGTIPDGMKEKRAKIEAIATKHGTDLRTAALQFAAAPAVMASVIPGARHGEHVKQNIASMKATIPTDFWAELKSEKLIAEDAPTPKAA